MDAGPITSSGKVRPGAGATLYGAHETAWRRQVGRSLADARSNGALSFTDVRGQPDGTRCSPDTPSRETRERPAQQSTRLARGGRPLHLIPLNWLPEGQARSPRLWNTFIALSARKRRSPMIGQTFTRTGRPKLVFRTVWRGNISSIDCVRGVTLDGNSRP
jgi:hypothetical protein